MTKLSKTVLAVVMGLAATQSVQAQTQVAPSGAASKASIPGLQEGAVYPGQSSAPAPQTTLQPRAVRSQTGMPGQAARGNRPQTLPELPGLPGEATPAQQAAEDIIPLDVAQQLLLLNQRLDGVLEAGSTPVRPSAKPKASHIKLSQKPDEDPPVVRVAPGMPTSLIFVDATGAPWPIEWAIPGASGQFDIMLPSQGTPTVQIRPRSTKSYGGVNVKLVNNPIPVAVIVAASQTEVDVRLDIEILKRGPNAIAPMIEGGSVGDTQADSILTSFLYGIPPGGAKPLKSSSKRVDAWHYNNLMYVRSTVPLVSPNPIKSSRSVDGTYAYVFTQVPIVNVTEDGVITSVSFYE